MARFRNMREAEEIRKIALGPIPLSKALRKELSRYLKLGDNYPFEDFRLK